MRLILVILPLIAAVGCSSGKKLEDFTPQEGNARKALDAALTHWVSGGQPGAIPNTKPVVEVTDTKWKSGQKIQSFEIVSDEPPAGAGPRFFKVKLTPATGVPVETRYAVLGIDPLLIYRDEDYQKLSGIGK